MTRDEEFVLSGSLAEHFEFVQAMRPENPNVNYRRVTTPPLGGKGYKVHLVGTVHFTKEFSENYRFLLQCTNNIVDHTLSKYGIVYVPTVKVAYELAKRLGISEEREHDSEKSPDDGVPICR